MLKAMIGAGALLLATAAIPASAHDWDDQGYGYGGYYSHRYYGGDYYDIVREHVRACRAHARFHEELNAAHAEAHEEGFDDSDEHADTHDALNEAHGEYHEDHPEVQHCGYWYSQWYNMNRGGYYRPYRSYWSYSYSN